KSAARIDGAIFTLSTSCSTGLLLKGIHELAVAASDVVHCVVPRDLLGPPVYERAPKAGTAHGEADKAGDSGSRRQPLVYFLVVLTPAQDDAADFVAATLACDPDDSFAILATIKTLDFPDIRLNARDLQQLDGLHHKLGTKSKIIRLPVPFHSRELRFLGWHQ